MSDDPNTQGNQKTEPGGNDTGGQAATFTQEDLNRAAGNARAQGRQAAIKDLLTDLGVEKLDDLKAGFKAFVDAENQRKSDLDKANEKISAYETQLAQLRTERNAQAVRSEVELQALALGANPERLQAVIRLREAGEGEINDEGSVDAEAIKQSVEAVLGAYPEFKKGQPNVGGGSNPGSEGEGGSEKIDVSNMSAQELAELQKRVMAGERIEIK
ncbi:MAG: hypothetical protein M3246_09625 [Actinomycetota bacterium]|nr:hypothetical protein [Actinomycetota bacterium]